MDLFIDMYNYARKLYMLKHGFDQQAPGAALPIGAASTQGRKPWQEAIQDRLTAA